MPASNSDINTELYGFLNILFLICHRYKFQTRLSGIFRTMINQQAITVSHHTIASEILKRAVSTDFYMPLSRASEPALLLINDGQDMRKLGLADMLGRMQADKQIVPLFCVAIHCGEDRKNEYGVAGVPDYMGRGAKAGLYARFVMEELLPYIRKHSGVSSFTEKSFAGFSLGGLSALDIVWQYPREFRRVGVFSGSLWWRSKGLNEGYVEERDRIMHQQIRQGTYAPWLKFFFETGTLDETDDRNNNGIIDSIDDTLALMEELQKKGYHAVTDMHYLELADGRHDVATWAKAMPCFLRWGWGLK